MSENNKYVGYGQYYKKHGGVKISDGSPRPQKPQASKPINDGDNTNHVSYSTIGIAEQQQLIDLTKELSNKLTSEEYRNLVEIYSKVLERLEID